MKLLKSFVATLILSYSFSLLMALLFGIIYASDYRPIVVEWFLVFMSVMTLGLFITELLSGTAYSQSGHFESDAFKVHKFSNAVIIEIAGYVWMYTQDIEKIARLEFLKVETYYTLRKKYNGLKILPYGTIKEMEKEKKNGDQGNKTDTR